VKLQCVGLPDQRVHVSLVRVYEKLLFENACVCGSSDHGTLVIANTDLVTD